MLLHPSIIGAATALTMNVLKNAGEVALGRKKRSELTGELVKDMYISACSLVAGGIGQAMIEVPVVGYMLGSFIGSLIGMFIAAFIITTIQVIAGKDFSSSGRDIKHGAANGRSSDVYVPDVIIT